MAKFYNNRISIAFDVYGCPQRCKHCWLGHPKHSDMDIDDVIDTFSNIKNIHNKKKYYNSKIEYFAPDFREPHYSSNYKELYKLCDNINGCVFEVEKNFELLSIWKITRDEEYAKWAKAHGIKRCQIKLFGMEDTNDFFYGRKGAHSDIIKSTEILLNNGIIPRWQIYLNKMGIDELDEVLDLTFTLELWKKTRELGEEFNIHMMTYDSDGLGFDNHEYRIDEKDICKIPKILMEKSSLHFNNNFNLYTESTLVDKIMKMPKYSLEPKDHWLWFFVTSNWDVYPNFMNIASWWRLGNLKKDNWETILQHYAEDDCIGLTTYKNESSKSMVSNYADEKGIKLYMSKNELMTFLIGKHCRMEVEK